jgi:prepilin-type N-terminal cleavage/methylation domain-containing protein
MNVHRFHLSPAASGGARPRRPQAAGQRGFTMIEIALCLAIIGFALVSILLVLPSGMNTQRDTRQETIIDQDASELLEAIRGGARGYDDLTNYVYAITNYVTYYSGAGMPQGPLHKWGYTYAGASYDGSSVPSMALTNGLRIIGILSTPEYGDTVSNRPIPSLMFGGISNHVVAYVRSFSGLAADKPPQDNQIMQSDSFRYRLLVVNAPGAMDTNLFQPVWQSANYGANSRVFSPFVWPWDYWQAGRNMAASEAPGGTNFWGRLPSYSFELARNQHELRLLFEWPELPNGNVGAFRQNFRTVIAGSLVQTNYNYYFPGIRDLYFYESQSFAGTP